MSQGRGNITWIANIDGIDGLGREYYLFLAVKKLCGGLADYAVLAHHMA